MFDVFGDAVVDAQAAIAQAGEMEILIDSEKVSELPDGFNIRQASKDSGRASGLVALSATASTPGGQSV